MWRENRTSGKNRNDGRETKQRQIECKDDRVNGISKAQQV